MDQISPQTGAVTYPLPQRRHDQIATVHAGGGPGLGVALGVKSITVTKNLARIMNTERSEARPTGDTRKRESAEDAPNELRTA